MLRVLTGRSGCGKSAQVFEEIAKLADVGETGILLLVPEQYAFNAERELCAKAGNSISLHAEVMSFKGLARRIFAASSPSAILFASSTSSSGDKRSTLPISFK